MNKNNAIEISLLLEAIWRHIALAYDALWYRCEAETAKNDAESKIDDIMSELNEAEEHLNTLREEETAARERFRRYERQQAKKTKRHKKRNKGNHYKQSRQDYDTCKPKTIPMFDVADFVRTVEYKMKLEEELAKYEKELQERVYTYDYFNNIYNEQCEIAEKYDKTLKSYQNI